MAENVNAKMIMAEFCNKIATIESSREFDSFCLDTRILLGEILDIEEDSEAQKWILGSIKTIKNIQINAKIDKYADKWHIAGLI